jgi:DNA-directed RNA polymerase beta subunit
MQTVEKQRNSTKPRVGAHVQDNEFRADLLSVSGMNPWPGSNSNGRVCMFSNHISQRLVISGCEERKIQTGIEQDFAKYTLNVKMPADGRIVKIVDKHKKTIGPDSIEENPETVVIYEDDKTKEFGIIVLPKYCSYHQYLGFAYKSKPGMSLLAPGQYIQKDTVFLDSPAVMDSGGYGYGINLKMAFMSHPSVSEDGIMVCEDVLPRLKFKTYETRVVEWGSKRFPLNLYGTIDNFKAFPEIGEYIRKDGLLAVLRKFDSELAGAEQSIYDLMQPDLIFDKPVYAGGSHGKIVDIVVYHQATGVDQTLFGMEKQIDRYDRAQKVFYREIYNEWRRLEREHGKSLRITPAFHQLVVEAMAMMDETSSKISKTIKHAPLDDYYVKFVIEYEITPEEGFKLTGCHGDKGIICKVAKPEEMPVDENGTRADAVMDAYSTVNRMNPSRMYELYINAASFDLEKKLRGYFGITENDRSINRKLNNMFENNVDAFHTIYNELMHYYDIISPKMFKRFSEMHIEGKVQHMYSVLSKGIFLFMPVNNDRENTQIIRDLEKHFRPIHGPVVYMGNSGRIVKTEEKVRVANLYMMLLDKTGDSWSASSSGKLQHFGILAPITKADKFAQPARNNPIRGLGESEFRIWGAYVGTIGVAEIADRNNNPLTHNHLVYGLLSSDNPIEITNLVDRKLIAYNGSKPIQLVNHIGFCSGWEFVYYSNKVNYTMKQSVISTGLPTADFSLVHKNLISTTV